MLYNVKAALFDLDGVIVFTDRFHFLAWKRLADEQGWRFDETMNHQLRGVSRMASLNVILTENGVSLSDEEKAELADRKNRYYVESLERLGEQDLYPGAVDFIQKLKARGVLIGLCSASRNAQMVLLRTFRVTRAGINRPARRKCVLPRKGHALVGFFFYCLRHHH